MTDLYDDFDPDFDADAAAFEIPDPFELMEEHDLASDVVEIISQFGASSRETDLLLRGFLFDPDASSAWNHEFRAEQASARERVRENALFVCLMTLVAPLPIGAPMPDTAEHQLQRWQVVTRNLLKLGEQEGVDAAWLYGWSVFGVDICYHARSPRLLLWDRRLSKVVSSCSINAQIGKVWADELPQSSDELLALEGIGPASVRKVTVEVIKMLLEPERWAPTWDEMLSA